MRKMRGWSPLWRQLWPERRKLSLGAALAALTVMAGMLLLCLSGWFISATAIAGLSVAGEVTFDVFGPSAGIRLLAIGRTGARYMERLVTHDATFAVLARIRLRLFRGWALADAGNRLLRRPARLLFRLTSDIDALESFYLRLLAPAFAAICAVLLVSVTLAWIDIRLGLIALLWLLVSGAGPLWLLWLFARRPALLRARALEQLRAGVIDLVSGQTELLMAGTLQRQRQLIARFDAALALADRALQRLDSAVASAYHLLNAVTLAAALVALAYLVQTRAVSVPLAALALLMVLTALEPLAALRRGVLEAARLRLALRRLGPRLAAGDAAPAVAESSIDIQLVGVDAAYVSDAVVLRKLDLCIASGERVALIGPSGAGKSTLLGLLAGELTPAAGSLTCPRASLFTQRTELFQDNLRDNLRLAAPDASDERLWTVLAAAGLANDVRALTHGLDTKLGEGGLGLSGGQLRRLALARLFLQNCRLWLLDEPTEALNAALAADVIQRLAAHAEGRTLLIATHLRREAELADRLLLLRDGELVADLRRGTSAFNTALECLRGDGAESAIRHDLVDTFDAFDIFDK